MREIAPAANHTNFVEKTHNVAYTLSALCIVPRQITMAESVNSSVRPGQLQMAEDERLSRTEYLKLLQAQISSHELAKNLAVSREDFVLAAELKDTVERLKQQHASLSSGNGDVMLGSDALSGLDKKAWASCGLKSDVSPFKGMKENPECWPLPFHLNQVEFQTGAQDRSYADMRTSWMAARNINVPGDADTPPISLDLPPDKAHWPRLAALHSLFDEDKDGLLNLAELNAHLMAASNGARAPLSEDLFKTMAAQADWELRPERDRLVLTVHKSLKTEQASVFMSHPAAERGAMLRAMRAEERESLLTLLDELDPGHRSVVMAEMAQPGITVAGLGKLYDAWSIERDARRVVPRLYAALIESAQADETVAYATRVAALCKSELPEKEKDLEAERAHCSDQPSYQPGSTMGEPSIKIGAMHTARGETLLTWACRQGELGFVKELLGRFGCSVNRTDRLGKYPLHKASEGGHVDVVRCLMASRADPRAQDSAGLNAMQAAMLCRRHEAVQVLIKEYGAKVETGDDIKLGLARPVYERQLF